MLDTQVGYMAMQRQNILLEQSLLTAIEKNKRYEKTLDFYADVKLYSGSPKWKVFADEGRKARQALGREE